MFRYFLLISLLTSIFVLYSANLYVTGSNDSSIKIWNDNAEILSKTISNRITCLEVETMRYSIIAGTDSGKLINWNIESNTTNMDEGNETTVVKSVLLINSSVCLAGYNKFVIFWSLPDLKQILKINDSRFGNIGDMKNLSSENIVLIVNKEKNMIVFSLNNNTILRVNPINEEGALDVLNRNLIFAPCIVIKGGDFCLFALNYDSSINQKEMSNIKRWITFPSLKILNDSFGVYSTSDGYFGFVNFETTRYTDKYKSLNKILSLDILNDRIVAGHQNGSISHFDRDNFKLIKTFTGHPEFSTIVVKKFIDYTLIQNLLSTTSTKLTSTTKTTTFSSTFLSTITSTDKTTLTIKTTTTSTQITKTSTAVVATTSSTTLRITSSIVQINGYLNFNNLGLDQVLKYLNNEIDLNDCISNCSQNGLCKLVNNSKLVCECFSNYAGTKCDINTLPCSSNPCRNNGSCINNLLNKTYSCECFVGFNQTSLFYGNNCEYKKDLCENEKCSNNGVCFDSGTEAKCKCFQYFNGSKCEIESIEIKHVKIVISTASIIAIIILILTFGSMIFCDLSQLFLNKQRVEYNQKQHRRNSTQKIRKPIYFN